MSISTILGACATVFLALICIDFARTRRLRRFVTEFLVLIALVILDALVTNAVTGRVAFGPETSPTIVVGVMFTCVALGIAARYLFYLRGSFSWPDLLKPLCISPIVLLPLIGSVQSVKELEPMQVVSFALLAFQNGFFWQLVLERASPVVNGGAALREADIPTAQDVISRH